MEAALNKIGKFIVISVGAYDVHCKQKNKGQLMLMGAYIFAFAVPTSWNHDGTFRHTAEGDDDMPGHVKSSLMGPSLNIPVSS